jgi:two-component system, NarL family, invasion response regulator UvrY
MIKVLITDDHPVVRRGIRQILEDDDRISLIHEASDGKELLRNMRKQEYDVILLDITLPGRGGLELIGQIKKIRKQTAVLVLSIHSEELYAAKALQNGASGYITKSSAAEELLSAILKVSRGERYISASLADKLTDNMLEESQNSFKQLLSPRETEVLNLLGSGMTLVQIAEELSLSNKTISTYRQRLLSKLNLKTTADLIRHAIIEGLKDQT